MLDLTRPVRERYLIEDRFATPRAAGAVDLTVADPGPGTRNVATDTGAKVSVAARALLLNGAIAENDPRGTWTPTFSRIAGRVMLVRSLTTMAAASGWYIGASYLATPVWNSFSTGFYISGESLVALVTTTTAVVVGVSSAHNAVATVLRAAGSYFLGRAGADWRLLYVSASGTDPTLRLAYRAINAGAAQLWLTRVAVPARLLPLGYAYLLNDTFGGDGALGGRQGDGAYAPEGGGRNAWQAAAGWSTSGGNALNVPAAATLPDYLALTAAPTTPHVWVAAPVTVVADKHTGVAARWNSRTNALHGIVARHDGITTVTLEKYVDGVATPLATTSRAYVAGARIALCCTGTDVRAYYNDATAGAVTVADAEIVDNGYHGVYSIGEGSVLGACEILPTGVERQYNTLERWIT